MRVRLLAVTSTEPELHSTGQCYGSRLRFVKMPLQRIERFKRYFFFFRRRISTTSLKLAESSGDCIRRVIAAVIPLTTGIQLRLETSESVRTLFTADFAVIHGLVRRVLARFQRVTHRAGCSRTFSRYRVCCTRRQPPDRSFVMRERTEFPSPLSSLSLSLPWVPYPSCKCRRELASSPSRHRRLRSLPTSSFT